MSTDNLKQLWLHLEASLITRIVLVLETSITGTVSYWTRTRGTLVTKQMCTADNRDLDDMKAGRLGCVCSVPGSPFLQFYYSPKNRFVSILFQLCIFQHTARCFTPRDGMLVPLKYSPGGEKTVCAAKPVFCLLHELCQPPVIPPVVGMSEASPSDFFYSTPPKMMTNEPAQSQNNIGYNI